MILWGQSLRIHTINACMLIAVYTLRIWKKYICSHELRTRETRQLLRSRRVLARAAVGVTTKIELPFAIFCVRS